MERDGMTPEQKLAALVSTAARPTPVSPVFSAALAERIARRRAVYRVLALVPVLLAAVAVLWALQDVMSRDRFEAVLAPLSPGVISLLAALATAFAGRFLAGVLARQRV